MGYFKWHVPYYYPRRRTALLNNMFTNIDRDYTNTHYYIDSMAYGRQARLQNSPVTSIVGICTSILHMESTNLESCSSFPTTSPRLIMISARLQMNIASHAKFCRTEQLFGSWKFSLNQLKRLKNRQCGSCDWIMQSSMISLYISWGLMHSNA